METTLIDAFTEIHVYNETMRAAICPRCEAKIYPPKLLTVHLEHHRGRDQFLGAGPPLTSFSRHPTGSHGLVKQIGRPDWGSKEAIITERKNRG